MDNFKTFLEDLASGRPAKKPVSSNLLKQRAKDNEKALKSGFMKMPDYAKKKFNEESKRHKNWPRPYTKAERDEFLAKKKKANKEIADKNLKQAQGYNPSSLSTRLREASAAEVLKKRYASTSPDDNPQATKRIKDHAGMKTYKMHPGTKLTDRGYSKKGKMAALKKQHARRPEQYGIKEEKKNCGCGQDPCITYGKKKVSESTRDKYNPKISDIRNKEKMKKVGLPAGKGPLVSEEKQKGIDGKVCWKGYKRMGTKKKGGKTVDNCVKVEDFVLDAFENYYLTELSPKTISSYQKKAGAQYRQLRKDGPTKRQDVENAYHQGYTSDKEYNKQHDNITKMKKRGRGLAASKGKGLQKEGAMKRMATDKEESKRLSASKGTFPGNDMATFKKKPKPVKEAKKPVVHSTKPDSLKTVKIKYNKPIKTKVTDIGPGGKEYVRKDWSEQMQLVTNLDLEESISNLVRRGVDKVQKAISDAEKRTGYKVDPAKRNIPNPVSGDNIAKRLYGKSQKKR